LGARVPAQRAQAKCSLSIVHMGSLGPLPAIDVSMDQKAPKEASRSAESQADLDSELDLLHRELGVKRGATAVRVTRLWWWLQ